MTDTPDFALGTDTPVTHPDDDWLGRGPFVERIACALVHTVTGTANRIVIGLDGPWGCGKSSLLRLIEHQLRKDHPDAVVLHFDPWIISSRDDLIRALIVDLAAALEAKPVRPGLFGLPQMLRRYGSVIEVAAPAVGAGAAVLVGAPPQLGAGVASAAGRLFARQQTLDEIKRGLGAALEKAEIPIVVLVDELDRLERAEVKAMAQAVRAVADFPRVAYVLAYDGDRVAEHLGDGNPERGRDYLQKIVQVPFQVPMPGADDLDDLLDKEIRRIVDLNRLDQHLLHDARYPDIRAHLTSGVLETLRDIKRVLATFQVESAMAGTEVDWCDLLGFIALRLKRSDMAARIRASPDAFVVDPIDFAEGMRRGETDARTRETSKVLLGKSPAEDRHGVALARLLFPRIREGVDTLDEWEDRPADPERICYWYPLNAVLRLGTVRGFASRPEVDALFAANPEDVCKRLKAGAQGTQFRNLLSRIDDRLDKTQNDTAQRFFEGVHLFQRHDPPGWLAGVPAERGYARTFSSMLRTACARQKAWRGTAVAVLERLNDRDDLVLLPDLLRFHEFAFGLAGKQARPDYVERAILDADGAEQMAAEAAGRWAKLMAQGQLLERLFDAIPLYAIRDWGLWDNACDGQMQQHLLIPEALDHIILLFFGGDWSTDAATLTLFLDRRTLVTQLYGRNREHTLNAATKGAYVKAAQVLGFELENEKSYEAALTSEEGI